jgi:hypothetical protein
MKSLNKNFIGLGTLGIISFSACKSGGVENLASSFEKSSFVSKYPEVPKEELINGDDALTLEVLNALKAKYKADLLTLQKEVQSTGATFVVAFLSPEVGNSLTQSN